NPSLPSARRRCGSFQERSKHCGRPALLMNVTPENFTGECCFWCWDSAGPSLPNQASVAGVAWGSPALCDLANYDPLPTRQCHTSRVAIARVVCAEMRLSKLPEPLPGLDCAFELKKSLSMGL